MNILIPDLKHFEELKQSIKKDGFDKLHILSDFDRTLTYGCIDGIKTPSIISLLRDGKHLSEEYAAKAHALFDKYQPLEQDQNIPLEQRKKFMRDWWEEHNRLLIASGLSFSDLKDIVDNGHLAFREGVLDFLDFLHQKNIPLVIFSASGCGDAIQLFFKKFDRDYSNIFYVINRFNWDKNGKALSTREPLVHSLSKDETILPDLPEISAAIKDRKNVILLGDSLGDLGMTDGFDYDHLLKIGFLNSDYDRSRSAYEKSFDVVLEGDGDFGFVNDIVASL